MKNKLENQAELLKSALDGKGTEEVLKWIREIKKDINVNIQETPIRYLKKWMYDKNRGVIRHETGRFFSIEGIRVQASLGGIKNWDQPIINQKEIGFLGFITKKIDGIIHFLVQAKIEPGNINVIQLSPTLQATKSNYQQTHGGKKPLYLEYFLNCKNHNIILDQLQSEQGARFLKKRNRNIIIEISEDIEIYPNFIWMTLGQLKSLMQLDNVVNMDSRTVISGITFGDFDLQSIEFFQNISKLPLQKNSFLRSALLKDGAIHSIDEIINFLTEIKSKNELFVEQIKLEEMDEWVVNEIEIARPDEKYFKVIGVDVEIDGREIIKWSQPMVKPAHQGLCAFVCKEINGILHFAVQAKLECGNFDIIELAPTVQTLTGDYRSAKSDEIPFLNYVINSNQSQVHFDSIQSEEGGRFYRESNRNCIIVAGHDLDINLPDNFIWMTLNQMFIFLKFNNYLNIQARNLIASIDYNKNYAKS